MYGFKSRLKPPLTPHTGTRPPGGIVGARSDIGCAICGFMPRGTGMMELVRIGPGGRARALRRRAPRLSGLTLALLFAFGGSASANPTGGTVVSGQASIASSGKTLSITNTPGTIINWQGFSIAPDELTRFIQQSASSAVLNRVIGQDPSSLLGRLQSNGRVFLITPAGIVFGSGARIDVAGLVASTLD